MGVEVISKVSSTLHTPLMSGANAIHGIILLGAILVTGQTESTVALVVGLIAIVLATVNMVGGFVVTDRMLRMFTRGSAARGHRAAAEERGLDSTIPTWAQVVYLACAVCFHPGAQGTSVARTARAGTSSVARSGRSWVVRSCTPQAATTSRSSWARS